MDAPPIGCSRNRTSRRLAAMDGPSIAHSWNRTLLSLSATHTGSDIRCQAQRLSSFSRLPKTSVCYVHESSKDLRATPGLSGVCCTQLHGPQTSQLLLAFETNFYERLRDLHASPGISTNRSQRTLGHVYGTLKQSALFAACRHRQRMLFNVNEGPGLQEPSPVPLEKVE